MVECCFDTEGAKAEIYLGKFDAFVYLGIGLVRSWLSRGHHFFSFFTMCIFTSAPVLSRM
jgi:hypothetical protein